MYSTKWETEHVCVPPPPAAIYKRPSDDNLQKCLESIITSDIGSLFCTPYSGQLSWFTSLILADFYLLSGMNHDKM